MDDKCGIRFFKRAVSEMVKNYAYGIRDIFAVRGFGKNSATWKSFTAHVLIYDFYIFGVLLAATWVEAFCFNS